jgi:glycosyltransferase involved in cell wall biosynthesis
MKIATSSKEMVSKLKGNNITYIFNKNDNIDDLIKLSKICSVKKQDDSFYDVTIDCNINASMYYNSNCSIEEILKPIKTKDYKFSIIIPNCNYGKWLDKCLNSVLNQTYKNFEIVFVDDLSSDDSLKIAKKLLRRQDKIIELKMKRLNGGARNEGLLQSTGDYIVYLDSDDWLIDNRVLEKYNQKLFGQDVMFVGVQRYKNGEMADKWLKIYKDKYEAMESGNSGSCWKVIKRELAMKPECLFNEGTLQEDRNHHCKICYYMKTFTNYGEISHVWNRDNGQSVTSTRDKAKWGTCPYRNYADCKQFLLEIIDNKDTRAIDILKKRLSNIENDIKSNKDLQH